MVSMDFDWGDMVSNDPDGLRDYQRAAFDAVHTQFASHRSTLLVMATGMGKTRTFGAIAKHWPGNVLILAHREELVEQAKATLEEMTGEHVEVEQGLRRSSFMARLVVGSVQSVQQKGRLERLGAGRFSLVIFDEAHHATAKTYRKPIDWFATAKVLGVTATPDRGDKKALGRLFETVAYQKDILSGIDDGYLVRVEGKAINVSDINLSNVVKVSGDLNAGQLDDAMVKGVEGIVQKTLELCGDRQGIAFFPGVKSAELAAERFNALKPGSACMISGETEPDERKRMTAEFKAGRIQWLCNCQVATEGFDAPKASVIVIGRPTLSRALYTQMAGRGTRPLPGAIDGLDGAGLAVARRRAIAESAKPACLLLDFVGNAGKHTLVGPADVLGGTYTDEEVKKAKERLRKQGGGDVQAALEYSRKELRDMAQTMRSKVTATVRDFNPFNTLGVKEERLRSYDRHFGFVPATENQRKALAKAGVPEDLMVNLSKHGASKLFQALSERREKKLATLAQVRTLRKFYPVPDTVGFNEASRAMEYVKTRGYGKTGTILREQIRELLNLG